MVKDIIEKIQDKFDIISLVVTFLVGGLTLSSFLSNYYMIYNKIKEESELVKNNFYQDEITKVVIKINDSEEQIIFNKPTLIEVKVKEKKGFGKEFEISCREQLVN